MTKEIRETLVNALHQYRGDDLERAKSAFRSLTPDQMQQQYGQSGETCRQILDGYQAHVVRVNAAREFIDRLAKSK